METLKNLSKRRKYILAFLLFIGLIATVAFSGVIFYQGKIEDKRNTSYYSYEASSYYVSNEIHMLFGTNTINAWDEATRNTRMDNATREAVYGKVYQSYRFTAFKEMRVTDLLYTIDDSKNIRYFAKVRTDKGNYKVLVTVKGAYITSFKIF